MARTLTQGQCFTYRFSEGNIKGYFFTGIIDKGYYIMCEMALIMLSELFNHSNISITKRYLGLRREELLRCYDLLEF